MQFINATSLHGKSGGAQWSDLLCALRISQTLLGKRCERTVLSSTALTCKRPVGDSLRDELHWIASAEAHLEGLIRTFALLALAFVVPLAAKANSAARDPRIGAWTLVSAQSTLDPPNKLIITSQLNRVHVVMSGETHFEFTVKSDGHPTAVPANPAFNQVELRKIDKNQAEIKELKDGVLVATVGQKLSSDGNELTTTTASAGHANRITVWTRTGGKKAPGDRFAGEWTQDLSKTRMRQGLMLSIEANGIDGVRFSGDFSYAARFDGKPYDLRNSRNDTVTLQLIEPHTVESIYRRDNQVTEEDRWVVSNDGQQMTQTTTDTLENGQRITEKLTFKRQ